MARLTCLSTTTCVAIGGVFIPCNILVLLLTRLISHGNGRQLRWNSKWKIHGLAQTTAFGWSSVSSISINSFFWVVGTLPYKAGTVPTPKETTKQIKRKVMEQHTHMNGNYWRGNNLPVSIERLLNGDLIIEDLVWPKRTSQLSFVELEIFPENSAMSLDMIPRPHLTLSLNDTLNQANVREVPPVANGKQRSTNQSDQFEEHSGTNTLCKRHRATQMV